MATTPPKNKIIIALDFEELDRARELVVLLKDHVGAFKIGKQLFTRYGPESVRLIHGHGGRVFLDLKFHDIPTTVAKASREAARLGVFIFNIHALGGFDMMQQAVDTISRIEPFLSSDKPKILAVTLLTSLGPEDLKRVGFSDDTDGLVIRLARLAKDAGVDGVVASPQEIKAVKKQCGEQFLVVTPGIRPEASLPYDQKRIMTPRAAVRTGADYIIVGRPVTQASDPLAVVKKIIAELEL